MRYLLIIAFIAVCGTTFAKDKVYEKLATLYKTDREKCFELSKKYIAKNEKNAIPYYFQSVIFFDKSKEARTIKGMYLNIYRSVSSAIKFEKHADDAQREKTDWNTHSITIWERSNKIINRLEKDGDTDLAQNLSKRLELVPSFEDKMDQKIALNSNPIKEAISFKNNKEFFGIPTGNEQLNAEIVAEQNLQVLINQYRSKNGLRPLTINENLAAAARYHATDQATQGYFDHSTKDLIDGKLVDVCGSFERIERFAPNQANGEIIAAGKASAETTLNDWLNSKEHKAILDDPQSESIGIGFSYNENSPMRYYWVVVTGY